MAKILREIKNEKGHIISTQEEEVPSTQLTVTSTTAAPNPEITTMPATEKDITAVSKTDVPTTAQTGTTKVEPASATLTNVGLSEDVPVSSNVTPKKKQSSTKSRGND